MHVELMLDHFHTIVQSKTLSKVHRFRRNIQPENTCSIKTV